MYNYVQYLTASESCDKIARSSVEIAGSGYEDRSSITSCLKSSVTLNWRSNILPAPILSVPDVYISYNFIHIRVVLVVVSLTIPVKHFRNPSIKETGYGADGVTAKPCLVSIKMKFTFHSSGLENGS